MRTTISVRHTEVADTIRAQAWQVMARLGRLSPHALEGTVVFDQTPLTRLVEIRLHVRGGQLLKGRGRAANHRTALDRAIEKVRRQLSRDTALLRGEKSRRSRSKRS